ncbi:Dnah3, partial [Symbiodinium sp. KB8]
YGGESLSEPELVAAAVYQVVAPKFLSEDAALFHGIVADVFPPPATAATSAAADWQSAIQRQWAKSYQWLMSSLRGNARRRGLTAHEEWMNSVVALYETLNVRHGFMVVGDTAVGKSAAIDVLAGALKDLSASKLQGNPLNEQHELPVDVHKVYPKAFSVRVSGVHLGECWRRQFMAAMDLYGYVDAVSREWTDGVAASLFRKAAAAVNADKPEGAADDDRSDGDSRGGAAVKRRQWLVFDGAIDAMWVEDMNTVRPRRRKDFLLLEPLAVLCIFVSLFAAFQQVLDDSKKLCLVSGEVIPLRRGMNVIFETRDLATASPATVSRCGMVYMGKACVPWHVVLDAWLQHHAHVALNGTDPYSITIQDMAQWMFPPLFRQLFGAFASHLLYPFTAAHTVLLVTSFCRFLAFLLHKHLPDATAIPGLDRAHPGSPRGAGVSPKARKRLRAQASAANKAAMTAAMAAAAAAPPQEEAKREFGRQQHVVLSIKDVQSWVECLFLFAAVWTFGSLLDAPGRERFDR